MVRPNQKVEFEPEPRYDVTILQFAAAGVQMSVMHSALAMYDRYMEAMLLNGRQYMSLVDFINQLMVRGMIEYGKLLEVVEKETNEQIKKAIEKL